jgi:long-chain acyl-CoA synthetase
VIYGLGWVIARVFFRLRVRGLGYVPKSGPLIIVPNHVSDLDPFVIGAALSYGHLRQTYWGADRDRAYKTAWRRLLGRAAHLFPVDDRAPAASMALAEHVLARGNILIWFPEQWRSPTGELQRFLPGIGMLVGSSGAKVVPAYIHGTFAAMPRGRRLPRLAPVEITFAPPIANADLAAPGADEGDYARIAEALFDAVARLGAKSPADDPDERA